MAKIPVGKTIASAYGFTFGNFLTVLGLSWVPLVLTAVVAYVTVPTYFAGMQAALTSGDTSGIVTGGGLMLLLNIVAFASFIMIYVGIARQALGLRSGPAYYYFSVDAAFWRLLLAYLLTIVIGIGGAFLIMIVFGILLVVFAPLAVIVVIVGFFGLAYVMLRLTFLQPALAVAEERGIVGRAWSLGKGNFWRFFAVLLAIMIPMVILLGVIQMSLFSSLAIVPPPENATPAEAAAFMAQMAAQIAALAPMLIPIAIVFYAAIIALVVSASAFAYRSLVPAPEGTAAEFA
jgi:hypothetical protein